MSTAPPAPPPSDVRLMTAEQFAVADGLPEPCELILGKVIELSRPSAGHGEVAAQIVFLLKTHARKNRSGRVVSNDSGVITRRGPDSVRGPDVMFYTADQVPEGPLPRIGYLDFPPKLVIEVKPFTEYWPQLLAKAGEYLQAGVAVVVLADPQTESLRVLRMDGSVAQLEASDTLVLPEIEPTMELSVAEMFQID